MKPLSSFCALASLCCLMLSACDKSKEVAQPELRPVRIAQPIEAAALEPSRIVASGLLRASEEVPLSFKVGGVISRINVSAGQLVSQGQLLASLDSAEIDAKLTDSRLILVRAQREVERARSLYERGMVSERVEQDARTLRDQARAAMNVVSFDKKHALIIAPANGIVLHRHADPNETVGPGQPVVVLGRLDKGWLVRAGLPAADIVRIAINDAVRVTLDVLPDQPIAGRVYRIAAASNVSTGTIDVDVLLPATKHRLFSGMVAQLEFIPSGNLPSEHEAALRLPASALLEADSGSATIFTLNKETHKVRKVQIQTGALNKGTVEVKRGISKTDCVVYEGAAWLSDGETVRIVP